MGLTNCRCGSEKKPGAPEGIVIPTSEIIGMTLNILKNIFKPKVGFSNDLKDFTGQPKGSLDTNQLYMASDFCQYPPERHFGDSPYAGNPLYTTYDDTFQALIVDAWRSSCQCKYPCEPPPFKGGQCSCVRYQVDFVVQGKYRDTPVYTYPATIYHGGPISLKIEEIYPGRLQYLIEGTNPRCEPESRFAGAFGHYPPRDWIPISFTAVVTRLDGKPDDCGDPPSNELPPPPPIPYPKPVLYYPSSDPPPVPEPPPRCDCQPQVIYVPIFTPIIKEKRVEVPVPIPGPKEEIYYPVPVAIPGPPGENGLPGPPGRNGRDGRDGKDAEVEFESLTVPIVSCGDDASPTTHLMTIQVIKGTENQVYQEFQQLAEMKYEQCLIKKFSRRGYRVLGGDRWFEEAAEEIPAVKDEPSWTITNPEGRLDAARIYAGIGNDPDEPPPVTVPNLPDFLTLLQAIIYGRLGLNELPGSVPETLLAYTDGTQVKVNHWIALFEWFIKQFDALVGKFPIEIEIEDVDPTTKGEQTKKVELANLSEAFAEMYGLNITSATNSDISINFLMRLAAEVIAAKNAALITQDYAKANASFIGYKGNQVTREINYAFNPEKLDSLEELLQETKGSIIGWEEQDKESIVGYLMELKFAAGIIKAAFFRGKNQLEDLKKEAENLMKNQETSDNEKWKAFMELINATGSQFNQGNNPEPKIKD